MPPDFLAFLSQLGPAGLAAVAVWWLTRQHEKSVKVLSDSHAASYQTISESIKEMSVTLDHRIEFYRDILEKNYQVFVQVEKRLEEVAGRISEISRELMGIQMRLESTERHLSTLPSPSRSRSLTTTEPPVTLR